MRGLRDGIIPAPPVGALVGMTAEQAEGDKPSPANLAVSQPCRQVCNSGPGGASGRGVVVAPIAQHHGRNLHFYGRRQPLVHL
jgi:hypothetical protein